MESRAGAQIIITPRGEFWVSLSGNTPYRFLQYNTGNANFAVLFALFCFLKIARYEKLSPHNPEVVGSNPSPATIQPSDFVMKSDGFLCTWLILRSKCSEIKHPVLLDPYFDPLSAKTEGQRFT